MKKVDIKLFTLMVLAISFMAFALSAALFFPNVRQEHGTDKCRILRSSLLVLSPFLEESLELLLFFVEILVALLDLGVLLGPDGGPDFLVVTELFKILWISLQ